MVVRRRGSICSSVLLLLALCSAASALDYQIEANIRYDRYPETVLDILQPSAPALANRPGVIVIHGQGDKESMLESFCLPFIRHGFVVANVEYRLANAAPAPAAVSDVIQAAQWFHDHAAKYKVDPNRILVTGVSAGGHLALMVGMTQAAVKLVGIIDFFGIADEANPLTYVHKGLPPILAVNGDADPLAPNLTKAFRSAGGDVELITVPATQPGSTAEQMVALWPQIFKWLKKHKISG